METVTVRMARSDRGTSWGFGVTEAPNRDVVIVNVSRFYCHFLVDYQEMLLIFVIRCSVWRFNCYGGIFFSVDID